VFAIQHSAFGSLVFSVEIFLCLWRVYAGKEMMLVLELAERYFSLSLGPKLQTPDPTSYIPATSSAFCNLSTSTVNSQSSSLPPYRLPSAPYTAIRYKLVRLRNHCAILVQVSHTLSLIPRTLNLRSILI
jgi:hypothetical protein